ncbi:MAG: tRNA-specific adenosine deaminase [Chlamydiia bacterium]|nr:tRNA-specific adenosine deaminase [Chlamydiia bacterium]
MFEAMLEAKKAYQKDEFPVGALIVRDDQVIARAHNLVESHNDASAHAEMLALKQAASATHNWRLEGCTLYTTLEPCVMCAGAATLFRVKKIVWCCPDIRHGAICSLHTLYETPHPIHRVAVEQDATHFAEIESLMKQFFREKRKEGKACKQTLKKS